RPAHAGVPRGLSDDDERRLLAPPVRRVGCGRRPAGPVV
ncbi:MAG: hypothetical protein AVDCRST_MAG76-236, partial [uncultured Acidimicrobiales bacterium]